MSLTARARILAAASLAVVAIVAGACGSDDGDSEGTSTPPADTTTATAAATTEATSTASAEATATEAASEAAYPVTVTDMLGREVEIAAAPERIVALSPTAVELVYALGGSVVGRSSTATFPEAAAQAEDVGSAYQPSIETVLSLEPDLIVADSVIHAQPQLRGLLEEQSVPVVFAGADSYDGVLEAVQLMGTVLDAPDEAEAVVADIEDALEEATAAVEGQEISAVILIADRDETLYAARDASYAGDILERMGITNPASAQPDSGPFPGYTAVAPEALLGYDPQFILTLTPAPEPAPRLSTIIPQIPPFQGLQAVQNEQVVELDVNLFVQAPGPRLAEALRSLAAIVGGEAS